jgi:Tol biopolymer transport system component
MTKRTAVPALAVVLLFAAATGAAASGAAKIGLAYAGGGAHGAPKIVIANANGSDPRTLAGGSVPSVSPNGASVAFGPVTSKGGLLVYSAAGKLTGKFFAGDGVEVNPIAWSHDSRYIAVGLVDVNATTQIGKSGVGIIDTSTGAATTVAHGQVGGVSWSPSSDTVVFSLIKKATVLGPSNLYTWDVTSSSLKQLTHDNHSLAPVWGKLGIAYDRFKTRKESPAYQIWLMNSSGHSTQITHTKPGPLVQGLVPVAVSANGQRMIAGFEGEDTDIAYTVDLNSHAVHQLKVVNESVTPWGISRDGKRVLVDVGGFEGPANAGKVESLSFAGGSPTILAQHGNVPSWDQ